MIEDKLTEKIIGAAFHVHNELGFGFREKIYQRAMLHRVQKLGLEADEEVYLNIFYDGKIIAKQRADLFVEKQIYVELKSKLSIEKGDEVQLVNYLKATNTDVGLLINFGESVQIKRKYRKYTPKTGGTG